MAKKAKKEKKGPKGKKARAKAKLDRQWGEQPGANDAKLRRGKSRLLSSSSKKGTSAKDHAVTEKELDGHGGREHDKNSEDRSVSDDSDIISDNDESESTPDIVGGAYSKLLKTIRQSESNDSDVKVNPQSGDEDTDMEEDMQDENEMSKVESDDDESSVDDEEMGEEENKENFDPFGKRFTEAGPLPEDDEQRDEIIGRLNNTGKVPVPHVDPMLELQISKPLLKEVGLHKDAQKTFWKQLAKNSFRCNRDVLKRRWDENKRRKSLFAPMQTVLYPFVTRYADCLINCQTPNNREQVQEISLLHIVNHVLTSRGRIQRHNRRIKAATQESEADEADDSQNEETFKDQGFTRPTVLVLLPTRGECYKFIKQMTSLLNYHPPKEYLDRFEADYGPPPEDEDDEGNDERLRRRKKILAEKGKAWQELFGDQVNDDDDFKLGIALSTSRAIDGSKGNEHGKKETSQVGATNVKLYTDFYRSDIIVASPLGLKMTLETDKDDGDSDFLSSIEICLVERADVMMMQNWDHVNDVLGRLNHLPSKNNETDFSRVRNYFLVDQAANWRQLIVSTEIIDPLILSTFKRFARSHCGMMKTRRRVSEDEGSIANVIVPVRQIFQRVPTHSFSSQSDDRMKYVKEKILPPILQNKQKHTMIFIPSYFDFVILRNHLLKREAEFVTVNEYSRVSETSRGRARFLQGRKPLMLYTGRAHFFLRHKIKGIKHLIFFGLPEHPEFYSDIVNVINEGLDNGDGDMNDENTTSSLALFTKYEAHALERVVGTKQSNRMIKAEKASFLFVS